MKTIIFDFGNVVGFFDHQRTLARLAEHTHLTPQAMYDLVYGSDFEDVIERGAMPREAILDAVLLRWQLRCDADCLAAAVADIFTPNPEVCDLIPHLARRYRLLLGSNTNVIHAAHFTRQFREVLGHFHHLVMSHEIGVRKPQPGFFAHCQIQALGSAGECLFVDDLPANLAGARAHGWATIHYRAGQTDLVQELRTLGIEA